MCRSVLSGVNGGVCVERCVRGGGWSLVGGGVGGGGGE